MIKNEFFILIFFLLQERVNNNTPEAIDSLKGLPIPKTFGEFLGTGMVLFLSSGVIGTMFNAWGNRRDIKDSKTKELETKLQEKNEENNKKDIQIEILKVRLENTERRNQELQAENRELKEQTNTGFTRQEQTLKEHIKNLERELENARKKQ